jgi:hypothetical protein
MWQRFAHLLRQHGYIVPSVLLVTLTFGWFVTYGTGRLFDEDPEGSYVDSYYDVHAACLLQGRLDVPAEAIELEAFTYNGKHYGYFGIVPALLRVPLVLLFPGSGVLWAPAMMLLACVLNMICANWLIRTVGGLLTPGQAPSRLQNVGYSLFLITVGLGSTNIFLGCRAFVYHEGITWGATFALLFYCFFLKYLLEPRTAYFLAACLCSLLSFFSRNVTGAGTLLCLALFAAATLISARMANRPAGGARPLDPAKSLAIPRGPGTARHWSLAVGTVALAVSVYFLMNYVRFGTTNGLPLHLYGWLNPDNLRKRGHDPKTAERIGGKVFQLSNFRTGLYNYASPGKIEFSKRFPWISLTTHGTEFPESKIHQWTEFSSFTATDPALLLLSLLGLGGILMPRSRLQALRLPALAALASGALILFCVSLTERYKHDCFPFLVLAGAAGLGAVVSLKPGRRRSAWLAVFVVLALFSVYANLACSLVYQRDSMTLRAYPNKWSAAKTAELEGMRRIVDRFIATVRGWSR